MKEILIFAGTRPEIIKMAPLVREFRSRETAQSTPQWRTRFCFTGQHLELALPFLKFFEVEPDEALDLMNPGQSLGELTSRACAQLDALFARRKDAALALVQGDTTTAFSGALVAFYHKVAVGHVEAGLRTSSIKEPFPEELNRRLITRIANWHYAPTERASQTLIEERTPQSDVLITGNTGIDAFLWAAERVTEPQNAKLKALTGKRLVLVTAHRRENIGTPLQSITKALAQLAAKAPDVQFVLPVHKNPRVVETVEANLRGIANFHLLDPLEYGDLVWTMKQAEFIISDSGGIQEEAPSLRKPVLVLRNETERPEAVEYGTSLMVGSDIDLIVGTALDLLSGKRKIECVGPNPYGDGTAAVRIVDHVLSRL